LLFLPLFGAHALNGLHAAAGGTGVVGKGWPGPANLFHQAVA
jgi:hypothetical protein